MLLPLLDQKVMHGMKKGIMAYASTAKFPDASQAMPSRKKYSLNAEAGP